MSLFSKFERGLLLELNEVEVALLRTAAIEVLEMVTRSESTANNQDPLSYMVEISANDRLPEDPILARLFPNAYQDQELSSEFRRYTAASLQRKKQEAIEHLLSALPDSGAARVKIATEEIDSWMRAINDLRLVLGVVLEVDEGSDKQFSEMDEEDPEFLRAQIFYWLGWLLESLIEHAAD